MASPSLGDECCAKFTSDTPHFFKIILDDTDTQKLRIPKSFGRRYGSGISSPISLKVPTGASCKVELTKCADGTWLNNGWSEFAKHYSLSYGSFLLFRYEGNCNFFVIICDKSATEISYPYGETHGSRVPSGRGFQEYAMEDDKDGISVEILDDIQPITKSRVRSPSPSSRPRKKIKFTSKDDISIETLNGSASKKTSPIIPSVDSVKRSGELPQKMEDCRRKATLLDKERAEALQRASSFKSKNPYFVAVMQPSYVKDKSYLSLPANFCRKYLPKHDGDAILSVSHRNAMSVGFRLGPWSRLSRGWKIFVRENHLEVGDVCVFELTNQTMKTFNVVIIRRVQESKTGQIPAKDDRKCVPSSGKPASKPTKTASAPQGFVSFKSENPSFLITTRSSSRIHERLCVPCYFMKKHIEGDTVNLTLQNGGKQWPVKVLLYPKRGDAYLSDGWRAFARENSVKAGDMYAFELINREDAVLRVHILSKSDQQ